MRVFKISIVTLLVCFISISLSTVAFAQHSVLQLKPNNNSENLKSYIYYSTEFSGPLSFTNLNSNFLDFEKVTSQSIQFGYTPEEIDIVIKAKNIGNEDAAWILTTGRRSLKKFQLYEIDQHKTHILIDWKNKKKTKKIIQQYGSLSHQINIGAGEEKFYVIRYTPHQSFYLPLKIQTVGTFLSANQLHLSLVLTSVSGILVLVLTNIIFFSMTSRQEFLWLGLAEFLYAVNCLLTEGIITRFIYLPENEWNSILAILLKCLYALTIAIFAKNFLETEKNTKFGHLFLNGLIVASTITLLVLLWYILFQPDISLYLMYSSWAIMLITSLYLPFLAIFMTLRINRSFWPLIVAWTPLAIFVMYGAIIALNLIPDLVINWHFMSPLGLVEALFATIALGFIVRDIQNKNTLSSLALTNSLKEQLKLSETSRKNAQEKAVAINSLNNQNSLIHASGHDSRHVILALNSAMSLIKNNEGAVPSKQVLEILDSSTQYLDQVVSTTLSGASLGVSNLDFFAISTCYIDEILRPLELLYRKLYKTKGLELIFQSDVAAQLVTDKALLSRAISNLLNNGYKYTDKGNVELTVSMMASEYIEVQIKDTGPGMSDSILSQIRHADGKKLETGFSNSGSGTGIMFSKRIIEKLSGQIEFENRKEGGCCVKILLPIIYSFQPCLVQDIPKTSSQTAFVDVDILIKHEERRDEKSKIAVTYDDSSSMRERLSEDYVMVFYKPLYLEMFEGDFINRILYEV